MEIIKEQNKQFNDLYDFKLVEGNKILHIAYSGALDSYWMMEDGRLFGVRENAEIDFEITKEDYEIYRLFENLYNEVITGRPYGMGEGFKNTREYNKLVDENNNITWISDNGYIDFEDRVVISKEEDKIKLKFIRNDLVDTYEFKSNWCISIRFRNDGSKYGYFHTSFQNLYNKIQDIDHEYHQYTFEEYEYLKRKENKKRL